ncbi:MAG: cyclase family protein [Vicinamibacterales bacterium]
MPRLSTHPARSYALVIATVALAAPVVSHPARLSAASRRAVRPADRSAQAPATSARVPRNDAELTALMKELSNWGRWGKDDQLGTINLITPDKRKQAAALVREGVSVSLARDSERERAEDNGSPYEITMRAAGMDAISVAYHGYAHTHIDALWHIAVDDKSYNGVPRSLGFEKGAPALSVLNLKSGIFTRGIVVDIPRLRGVRYLEPGAAIYPEDLDAWEKKTGVKIGSGDAVFIYTGRWARRAAVGPWNVGQQMAGLHASAARWLKTRDVAMLGHDGGNEMTPTLVEGVGFPLHQLAIVAMGMPLLDNCDLEAVAEAAAKRGRWDFLLTVAPLAIRGGTGSPANPIATF